MSGSSWTFDDVYKVKPENWYRALPYGFYYATAIALNPNLPAIPGSITAMRCWLPIAPHNLTITTHFATNIITTLYGVVEEHSEVRYYDITIQGTTGFSPRFPAPSGNVGSQVGTTVAGSSGGRRHFVEDPFFAALNSSGFMQQTLGTATAVAQQLQDLGGKENKTGLPQTPIGLPEGTQGQVTGYLAFHNMYRLLQLYKRDASGQDRAFAKRKYHPLQFINNKDGNQYDVIPITFTLSRSAESPMLYNYNIVMRGFNLRSADASKVTGVNWLNSWGLGGGGSVFNKISNIAGGITSAISGLGALAGGIGG